MISKEEIKAIIKGRSVKKKTNLFLEDVALFNIKGEDLVTEEERTYLFDCIKTEKHYEYYNSLRAMNKSFLIYKGEITTSKQVMFRQIKSIIAIRDSVRVKANYCRTINRILTEVTDKEQKEIIIKNLDSNILIGGYIDKNSFYKPFTKEERNALTEKINKELIALGKQKKMFFNALDIVEKAIEKYPFTAYKDFIEENRDKMSKHIENNLNTVSSLTNHITGELWLSFNGKEVIRGKVPTDENELKERNKIINNFKKSLHGVKEIVTEEDVENFKRAGI